MFYLLSTELNSEKSDGYVMSGSVFDIPSEKDLINKKQKIEEELKSTDLAEERKSKLLDELNDVKADLIEIEAEKQDRNKII
tara:strand:+ start:116 stop:361 length:246 start_codon:yes stop_codon:yes gene_type:complete